jgi:hypothetical protein
MKERFKFETVMIYNEKKGLEERQYFKIKQVLTWQLYIRPIKLWFEPCPKCQALIDEEYSDCIKNNLLPNSSLFSAVSRRDFTTLPMLLVTIICKDCKKYLLKKMLDASEVILGNKDYEPMFELSRRWFNDEDSRIQISKEDYEKSMFV